MAQDCEIISGNLDVFVPKDFSLKDVANNFEKLLAVSGDVVFFDTGVDDLGSAAFPSLFVIGGSLSVSHNPRVQALSGFRSLFSAGSIKVWFCAPHSHGCRHQPLPQPSRPCRACARQAARPPSRHARARRHVPARTHTHARLLQPPCPAAPPRGRVRRNRRQGAHVWPHVNVCMPRLLTTPPPPPAANDRTQINKMAVRVLEFLTLDTVGELTVSSSSLGERASFPALRDVARGSCSFTSSGATDISFPELASVAAEVSFTESSSYTTRTFAMPKLTKVGARFYLSNLQRLHTLDIKKLASVTGAFYLYQANALQELAVPALATVG